MRTSVGTIDPAFVDILVAARTASCKLRDGKRDEANEAVLAAAIADFDAMDRQAPRSAACDRGAAEQVRA